MKIAVNARLELEESGGKSIFLGALIRALGELDDSDETYVLVGMSSNREWLESIRSDNQIVSCREDYAPRQGGRAGGLVRKAVSPLLSPFKQSLRRELAPESRGYPAQVPLSDGYWEQLGCQVVHFPFQDYEICGLPTVFNPHDLQQLHYPEYFNADELAWRESLYPAACHFARTVVTASQWVKEDIMRNYGTDPGKIQVIPWAPPTQFYEQSDGAALEAFRVQNELPARFALYPSITWPHKNHLRLLEALAQLRDQHGLTVPLICTGSSSGQHKERVDGRVSELGLQQQVRFLGFLSDEDLRKVYRLSTMVVVPTLFEAASGPVFEAWQEGKAVACSTVTSLPEQVGDAALLFDPESVQAIGDAVKSVFSDDALRENLEARGKARLNDFSWERTAKAYRAVYRRAAHAELGEEDRMLLQWDWMKNPGRDER